MKQIMKTIENWWKDGTKFLSGKKREINKSIKPSKTTDTIRWVIAALIVLAALSLIITFAFYGIVVLALATAIYLVIPTDSLKEVANKISKSATKLENKAEKTVNKAGKKAKKAGRKAKKVINKIEKTTEKVITDIGIKPKRSVGRPKKIKEIPEDTNI